MTGGYTDVLYALMSAAGVLALGTISRTREEAEKLRTAEFPADHVIYPDHHIVLVRISILPEPKPDSAYIAGVVAVSLGG
jgi:hypothetical protein